MSFSVKAASQILKDAIKAYCYPCRYFDFEQNSPRECRTIKDIEDIFLQQLSSNDPVIVKNGLANVIFWGFANAGFQMYRFNIFTDRVTRDQVGQFIGLRDREELAPRALSRIELPQLSGMAFISKVLMFTNPKKFCVLDSKISKLRGVNDTALNLLNYTGTSIRVTYHNQEIYQAWCRECAAIGMQYFKPAVRAADVERGFFELINSAQEEKGREVYRSLIGDTAIP